ncbi:MAG: hypothetical protein H0W64_12640 [Gammaproteobacteria bacterium]|nr:hypothetical protein [Gammaproteobacteria bacterium]
MTPSKILGILTYKFDLVTPATVIVGVISGAIVWHAAGPLKSLYNELGIDPGWFTWAMCSPMFASVLWGSTIGYLLLMKKMDDTKLKVVIKNNYVVLFVILMIVYVATVLKQVDHVMHLQMS